MALHLADRGYVIEIGKIIITGEGDELKNNEKVKKPTSADKQEFKHLSLLLR